MKQLFNTLYILSEDLYLSLDGENIVVNRAGKAVNRYPLHTLQNIVSCSYAGASPALMGACAERQIGFAFCTPRGKFLARVCGESSGNVLLRRLAIVSKQLAGLLPQAKDAADPERLRGLEGVGASAYFSIFNEMILGDKETFSFNGRSRRPPLDAVNALLSFAYSLLAHECASALESVGLDSYVGFLHRDRPGRSSLALDLMEELRPCMADRFVLTLINNRKVKADDFQHMESGAVLLTENGRRAFTKSWHEKRKETLTHPYLGEKLAWGMVPYVQALLLARYLRGDLDDYPPFLWK